MNRRHIALWIDDTDGPKMWVISKEDQDGSDTIATYPIDQRNIAKDHAQQIASQLGLSLVVR